MYWQRCPQCIFPHSPKHFWVWASKWPLATITLFHDYLYYSGLACLAGLCLHSSLSPCIRWRKESNRRDGTCKIASPSKGGWVRWMEKRNKMPEAWQKNFYRAGNRRNKVGHHKEKTPKARGGFFWHFFLFYSVWVTRISYTGQMKRYLQKVKEKQGRRPGSPPFFPHSDGTWWDQLVLDDAAAGFWASLGAQDTLLFLLPKRTCSKVCSSIFIFSASFPKDYGRTRFPRVLVSI